MMPSGEINTTMVGILVQRLQEATGESVTITGLDMLRARGTLVLRTVAHQDAYVLEVETEPEPAPPVKAGWQ